MKSKYFDKLFLIFIISLPFSWANIGLMSIYRIITIVCFGIWLVNNHFRIRILPNNNNIVFFRSWIGYAGYSIAAYILFPSNTNVIFGMILLVMISLIFFSTEIEEEDHKYLDYLWMIAGLFFVVLFISGRTSQVGWGTRQTITILGTKTDANEFASFFVISLPIALHYFICKNGFFNKLLSSVLLISGTYVVLMTGSRGALLSLVVALLVTLFISKKFTARNTVFIILLALTLVFIIPNYIMPLIPKATLSRLSLESMMNGNSTGRSDIWRAALDKYASGNPIRWVFGYGYWGLSVTTWTGTTGTMHNQYLQQLIAYGVIGLVLYVNLLFRAYRRLNLGFNRYKGAFIGILFMGLTITMGPSYKMLWILLFMAGITSKEVENENGRNSDLYNS